MGFKLNNPPFKKENGKGTELTAAEKRAAMANAMPEAEVETVSDNTKIELGEQSGMTAAEVKARQKNALNAYNYNDSDSNSESLRATNSAAGMGVGREKDGESWLTGADSRTHTVPVKTPVKKKKKY
tara:strand:- start:1221 stop:1601 length:381 start_codon:yes stop_codon:yes gene_type:complete